MGSIREIATGRTQLLEPEHCVGRAPISALRLDHRYVSAQHTLLRWTGDRWEVKDLGSRNGTFLDGARLKPGEEYPARQGARLCFGKAEQEWELADASPPQVMAVPLDGGDPALLDGELLALPSSDDPRVTIYRASDGAWALEQPDESITRLTNSQIFEIAGRPWRFCCTENISMTSLAGSTLLPMEVRHLQLSFAVSRDEEHVELAMTCSGRVVDLGARSHNYLLLTLARRYLADAAEGLPETTCGWIDQEDLAHDPSMAPPQLNIEVFRIRRQFAAAGVVDAANIVERRPRTRQLRIGTGRVSITTL